MTDCISLPNDPRPSRAASTLGFREDFAAAVAAFRTETDAARRKARSIKAEVGEFRCGGPAPPTYLRVALVPEMGVSHGAGCFLCLALGVGTATVRFQANLSSPHEHFCCAVRRLPQLVPTP